MDKHDESYLDNLLQEYGKESPVEGGRRVKTSNTAAEKKAEKSGANLMLDSLENEFDIGDIDEEFLGDIDFGDLDKLNRFGGDRKILKADSEEDIRENTGTKLLAESPVTEVTTEEVLPAEEILSEDAAPIELSETFETTEEPEENTFLSDGEESHEDPLFGTSEIGSSDEDLSEGDFTGESIGSEELFSGMGELHFDADESDFEEAVFEDKSPVIPTIDSSEENVVLKRDTKKKSGIGKLFSKLFSNIPLTEEELAAIPTPEEELELKKEQEEQARLKKEEKKAKAEEKKKLKAEEAKKKAAENKAKRKAKEEAKKEAKKNAELRRLRAEAAFPPEGKINKAGAFIVLLVFLLTGIFIIFGSSALSYDLSIASASYKFEKREYNEAFQKIRGLDVKEKDMDIRDKINTVMFVNKQLNSYNNYYAMGDYANALDSLVKGLFRYDKYIAYATQIGIKSDLNYVRKQILSELADTYQMSERDVLVLMGVIDRREYSENVYKLASKVTKKPEVPQEEVQEFVP